MTGLVDVTVQYFKYPDSLHWRHDLVLLGEDEFGTWLGANPGARIQRGHEPPMRTRGFVQLIPDDTYSLIYRGMRAGSERYYVDIITKPVWHGEQRVEMFDLDLDVTRHGNGSVEVLDEDEFDDHRERFGYPPWMIDVARTTTARIFLAVQAGDPPFGTHPDSWYAKLH